MTILVALFLSGSVVFADVSVTASVNRNRVSLGESVNLTITIMGSQDDPQGTIPSVDGLNLQGPVSDQKLNMNGQLSRMIGFQATPARLGEFVIPSITLTVGGKQYTTQPIKLTVEKDARVDEVKDNFRARVELSARQAYAGQGVPFSIQLLIRQGTPVSEVAMPQCSHPEQRFQFQKERKQANTIVEGVQYVVVIAEGVVTFAHPGKTSFGPCAIQCAVQFARPTRNWVEQFMGHNVDIREVSVPVEPSDIEVLPLPEASRPAEFSGAVGQWNLEVTGKPTDVTVGDPITLTIKISGTGNADLMPEPKLTGLDEFKTYDPIVNTTKNELHTAGERTIQQVLIARGTDVKQLPEISLNYFDPVAKEYKTVVQSPIPIVVKAGASGRSTVVSGGARIRPEEKLGQDIVYLKGDAGTTGATRITATFWALNILPVVTLAGVFIWKRRMDKLRSDVAYARRSRAARNARKLLDAAGSFDAVQHALQSYLGDRLNIPAAGITASVAGERKLPARVREIFEACDAARFAGAQADLAAIKKSVEQVIDELETSKL